MKTHKTNKPTLGSKLRFFRERNELTQLELAEESGLDLSTVTRIENDTQNPDKETLYILANALFLNAKETAYLFGINIYAIEIQKLKAEK